MSLFNGVENFTPAFTGRQLAIESGKGAGQSISRGSQVGMGKDQMKFDRERFEWAKQTGQDTQSTSSRRLEFDRERFQFAQRKYTDQMSMLGQLKSQVDSWTEGSDDDEADWW